MLRTLRVGPRLGLGFGLILLITALTAGIGIWRIQTLAADSERVSTVEMERQAQVERWAAGLRLNWVRTEAFLKAIDREYMDQLQASTEATTGDIAQTVQRVHTLVTGDAGKALLANVDAAQTAYTQRLAEIRELYRGGEPNVPSLVDKDLRPLADKTLTALDALRQHMAQLLTESLQRSSSVAQTSEWILGACALAAIALGLALAALVTRSIVQPMQRSRQLAQAIAQGDLTYALEATGSDEPGQLLQTLGAMQQQLAGIVGEVRRGAEGVATASAEIAHGNSDLSARTEQQASALEETSASMEELNSTVRQNADNARAANQLALKAQTVATQGGDVVAEVVRTMKGINDSSRKIEVRSLAGRSADAAKEIKALIGASVERVEAGSALVDRAGSTMSEVVEAIGRVTEIVSEISAASQEQSQGGAQVGEAVTQMDQATQQNAALVEESAAAADGLKVQAAQLVHAVAVFRLSGAPQAAQSATRPAVTQARGSALRIGPA